MAATELIYLRDFNHLLTLLEHHGAEPEKRGNNEWGFWCLVHRDKGSKNKGGTARDMPGKALVHCHSNPCCDDPTYNKKLAAQHKERVTVSNGGYKG